MEFVSFKDIDVRSSSSELIVSDLLDITEKKRQKIADNIFTANDTGNIRQTKIIPRAHYGAIVESIANTETLVTVDMAQTKPREFERVMDVIVAALRDKFSAERPIVMLCLIEKFSVIIGTWIKEFFAESKKQQYDKAMEKVSKNHEYLDRASAYIKDKMSLVENWQTIVEDHSEYDIILGHSVGAASGLIYLLPHGKAVPYAGENIAIKKQHVGGDNVTPLALLPSAPPAMHAARLWACIRVVEFVVKHGVIVLPSDDKRRLYLSNRDCVLCVDSHEKIRDTIEVLLYIVQSSCTILVLLTKTTGQDNVAKDGLRELETAIEYAANVAIPSLHEKMYGDGSLNKSPIGKNEQNDTSILGKASLLLVECQHMLDTMDKFASVTQRLAASEKFYNLANHLSRVSSMFDEQDLVDTNGAGSAMEEG